MASRAFSEPVPQSVRGLGTTWVTRGGAYWARRARLLVARALVVLVWVFLAGTAVTGIRSLNISAGYHQAIYIGMAICWAAGFAFGVRTAVRALRRSAPPPHRQLSFAGRVFATRLVILLLLPAAAPFYLGFVMSWLPLESLGRELPEERVARLDLERQRREVLEESASLATQHAKPATDPAHDD